MAGIIGKIGAWIKRVLEWWQASRPGRSLARYNAAAGSLLSGGLAYSATFSIFAALVIGYTAMTRVLSGQPELTEKVLNLVDEYIPGLVDNGDGGVLSPDQLLMTSGTGITAIVAAAVLLWSALSFMGGLRSAVRTVLETQGVPENPLLGKLKDLGGYGALVVALLVSAILSTMLTVAASWVGELIGHGVLTGFVSALGLLIALAIDTAVFGYVVVVMGMHRGRKREVVYAGLVVAVVVEGIRVLGAQVITGSASRNALLASFAVIITLLMVVNIVTQVTLIAAAWLAEGASSPDRVPRKRPSDTGVLTATDPESSGRLAAHRPGAPDA